MANLDDIVSYLNDTLKVAQTPDYPGAMNGLQLRGGGEVNKVVAAVDAALPVVKAAVEAGADLLVVHHGMFWFGAQMIDGATYEKLKLAMDAGMAIYASHIPLDVHPELGNTALLGQAIGLGDPEPFFEWKGIFLGQKFDVEMSRDDLMAKVGAAVGGGAVNLAPGGPEHVKSVGVITGGAGSQIAEIAAEGVDTFITGEGPHHTFTQAEELGVNLIYAGHYATETFGVKAVGALLAKEFGVEHDFFDHPTGL